MILKYILYYTLLTISLIYIAKKSKILSSNCGDKHQSYSNKIDTPLVGGLILMISFSVFFYQTNIAILISSFLMFLIGFFSDLRKINSPKIRFLLQVIFVIGAVFFLDLELQNLRISFLDHLLNFSLFNIFFVTLCLVILINGSNFIDGINGLNLGYHIIIFLLIFFLSDELIIYYEKDSILLLIISLCILFLFNINNQLFLGDSGAYLLGFISGIFLIEMYQKNQFISPFFIVLLLWYPAFEVLFSIIRKLKKKSSIIEPDIGHMHQVLFSFIKKKNYLSVKINNNLTGMVINFFNLTFMIIGALDYSNSAKQILLILLLMFLYIVVFYKLKQANHSK